MITLKNKTVTIELIEIGARINAIVVNGVDIALGFNSQAVKAHSVKRFETKRYSGILYLYAAEREKRTRGSSLPYRFAQSFGSGISERLYPDQSRR